MTDKLQRARLLHLATGASLTVALTLVVAKAAAWWFSGSVSMLAGLTDSLLDGAASLLNLLAVRYALRPADDDHRYGHGKAESLSGMGQALFIAVSAVLIGTQALDRLQHPEPIGATGWGILVMLLSLALTAALLILQRYVIKRTGSLAVQADSLHYRSDLLLNGSILVALVLARYGFPRMDAIFGLGIACYILWSAVAIARESLTVLMDEELPVDVSARMLELACQVPGVAGAHDLRTRVSGEHWFVQLHLEFPGDMRLSQAHKLCDEAVLAIRKEFPKADVLVHADPLEVVGKETIS